MIKATELIKRLNTLYDYGEAEEWKGLDYLISLSFLSKKDDRYIVTKKWVKFSGGVTREDFISSLTCYYPSLLEVLLIKAYREAVYIGRSGDSKSLYEFIDSIPKFAEEIVKIKDKELNETDEIRGFYSAIFNGYPQYLKILSVMHQMQKAEDYKDMECNELGKVPNENWVRGRKVSSNIKLEPLKDKSRYMLTPYIYSDYKVDEDIKDILTYPWKAFAVVLGMVVSEYKAEGFEGLSIRPENVENPYSLQPLYVYIYNVDGKEVRVGRLNDFVYELCIQNGFLLFPDTAPDMDIVVFTLMENDKITYKDGEYVLKHDFDERIYAKEIILKNKSRMFKRTIKDYIESLRREL